jgi:cytoskeletal protein CcmA (bactofilin family)
MNERAQDLHISGFSEAPGGVYGSVSISGAGELGGSVKCTSFRCSGSAEVDGDLQAGELRSSGNLEVEGDLDVAGQLSSSGNLEVEGNLRCGDLVSSSGNLEVEGSMEAPSFHCSGAAEISGSIQGGEIRISGSVEVYDSIHCSAFECSGSLELKGDLESETVKFTGDTEIGGLLNAEVVTISARAKSQITNIGGSTIRVLRKSNGLFGRGGLKSETIEGDTVELENTTAQVVRGKQVVIGEGCHIQRVEYSESLDAHPGTVEVAQKV